jgi:hypothetical protein
MNPRRTLTPQMRSRLGVVGGGIGNPHRYARRLDDHRLTLDGGVFGRLPRRSSVLAAELRVPAQCVHQDVRRYTAGRGVDDAHASSVRGVRLTSPLDKRLDPSRRTSQQAEMRAPAGCHPFISGPHQRATTNLTMEVTHQ